ncbi:MAG: hypothetical protein AB1815_08180 [Bacillota bacterium]|jgi:hypothetical protein
MLERFSWIRLFPARAIGGFTARPACRRFIRLLKGVLLSLLVIFSPFLVWVILALNRELIIVIANSVWLSSVVPGIFAALGDHVNTPEFAAGFNEASLGGLLTLFGVIVTVWYYHVIRIQEVTEKRLFVIDELLKELKRNRRTLRLLAAVSGEAGEAVPEGKDNEGGQLFQTEAWHKLGADVVLLPRRLHMRLSVLYGCLRNCKTLQDCDKHRATIDRIHDLISDLHQYRSRLGRATLP